MHKLLRLSRSLRGQKRPRLESLEDRTVLSGFGMPTDMLLASAATPPLIPALVSTARPTLAAQANSNTQAGTLGLNLKVDLTGSTSSTDQIVAGRANPVVNFSLRIGFSQGDSTNGNTDVTLVQFGQNGRVSFFIVISNQGSNAGSGSNEGPFGSGSGGNTGGSGSTTGPIASGSSSGNSGFFGLGTTPTLIANPANAITSASSRQAFDGTTTSVQGVPVLIRSATGLSSVAGVGGAYDVTASNQSLSMNVVPRSGIPSLSSLVGGAAQHEEEEEEEMRFEDLLPNVQPQQEKPDAKGMEEFTAAIPESKQVPVVTNFQATAPGVLESALGEVLVEVKEAGGEVAAWLSDYRLEGWLAGLAVAGSMLEVARRSSQEEEEKTPGKIPNRRLGQQTDE